MNSYTGTYDTFEYIILKEKKNRQFQPINGR